MIKSTWTVSSALFIATLIASAVLPAPVSATIASKPSAALISQGKSIAASNCAKCHGADLKGMQGFSPSITASGETKQYTAALFQRMLAKDVDQHGQPLQKPMSSIHLPAVPALAVYTYLKTLK